MSRSLSLVLPVCNAEQDLAEQLQSLFEVLSDFTESFEVLLVDQGSTEQAVEAAQELAVRYPQVRLVRAEGGADAGWERTVAQTRGELVFIQTGHAAVRPSALRQLWEIGAASPQRVAPPRRRLPGLPPRPPTSQPQAADSAEVGAWRLVRRPSTPSAPDL